MKERKLMDQFGVIFAVFISIFYIGFGLYFAFFINMYWINQNLNYKLLFRLIGFAFTLYGVYRAFRTYLKFKEVFFSSNKDEE
jgi:hypothetical protein